MRKALQIAASDLRQCYGPLGIKTGSLRDTYWSWDSFFASFGSLELGDHAIVKTNLASFLKFMRKDGCIPRRISAPFLFYHLKFITGMLHPAVKRPSYSVAPLYPAGKFQNLVFMISFAQYIRKARDRRFLVENAASLARIMDFSFKGNTPLIEETFFQNWSETVMKRGRVLFTNVLYYRAIREYIYLLKLLRRPVRRLEKLSIEVRKAIIDEFWAGNYFVDWIEGGEKKYYFSADGNLAAILFDVCSLEQAKKIERTISRYGLEERPMSTNYPKYPLKDIYFLNWVVNRDYHNGWSWLWLGCLDAVAKNKVGMKDESRTLIGKIARIIERDKTVSEIYDARGMPLQSLVYRAEQKFAWSAGLFLWAYAVIAKDLLKNL